MILGKVGMILIYEMDNTSDALKGELQRASVVRFGLEFGIYAAASR
jgi:hypothetical protein